MSESGEQTGAMARGEVEQIYLAESRRVFASLVRLLGDFDLAEEALHEAFAAALEQWPRDGLPARPRAWLVSVGRFRGIDAQRRRRRLEKAIAEESPPARPWPPPAPDEIDEVEDPRLALLFACCRPELPRDAQVALTLREVCGLTTEEIGRAYLTKPSTIAQRIVRAKQKIRELGLKFEIPDRDELPARRELVLEVLYLVFNEGYAASRGSTYIRTDLSDEAIRLTRLLCELLPHPDCESLLALFLLQDARRAARTSSSGELILFNEQDRGLWDQTRLREGKMWLERALTGGAFGSITTRAAIALLYGESAETGVIDWPQIIALHEYHVALDPQPVSRLARAIAILEGEGPKRAASLLDELAVEGKLEHFPPFHAARGELFRRLGSISEAKSAYEQALSLSQSEPERRLLERKLGELVS